MNPFLDSVLRWFAMLGLVLAAWFVLDTRNAARRLLGADERAASARCWIIRGPAIVVLGSLLYLHCQAIYSRWGAPG